MATPARSATPEAPERRILRDLDIFGHSVAIDMPGLDAVIVVDRVLATRRAQLILRRLDHAGLVDGPRLQEQLGAVPVELVIKAVERHRQARPVDARRLPVAPTIQGHVDAL